MKIWSSYGSEHSAQLVLIGRFKSIADAAGAHQALEDIKDFMRTRGPDLHRAERYPPEFQELLKRLECYNLSTHELDQFSYDVHATLKEDRLEIHTDEPDISAFLKIMVDRGARVEVFSTISYPGKDEE
jgi:hypothetical protein